MILPCVLPQIDADGAVACLGLSTAEDCAKKLQSRAEIWVAEHE